jgi:hypothetical protein
LFLMIFFLLPVGGRASAAAQTDLIFPIYVSSNELNCRMWFSVILLFNPHSTSTTVAFNAFDSAGNVADSRSVSISPYMSGVYTTFVTRSSWVRGTATQSVLANETLQLINTCLPAPPPGVLGAGDVRSRIDVGPAAAGKSHFVSVGYDPSSGLNTGISIVYPGGGAAAASGKLINRASDGTVVSQRDIVIPANGQVVGMISDLLAASTAISGSLEITFDQSVAFNAFEFGIREVFEDTVIQPIGGQVQ